MHRRIVPAAALAGLLAVTACSGPAADGSDRPADPGLVVWVDEARSGALDELATGFAAELGTAVQVVPRASESLRDDYVRAVLEDDGPDVLVGAHDWLGELVMNGVVVPVEIAEPGAFAPVAVEAMTYDGATYGTPLSIENVALVRNDALVTTTPETFDEVVEQGAELVAQGRASHPVLVQQGEGGDPYHLYPIQTSFGAPAFRADELGSYTTELALGGDAGHEFAQYLASLAERGVLDPAITADAATEAFLAGRAPYVLTGPWSTAAYVEAGMQITVLPVPPAADLPAQPFVGVQGAFVNSLSSRPDVAERFVGLLASAQAQLALYRATGRAPALTAALDEITDDRLTTGFAQAGAEGAPMPAIPQMGLVWLYWGDTEAAITAGSGDPVAQWDQMVTNIELAIAAGQ